ncbi:MAG: hypothetical protein K1X75_06535 [Leptospirales bacterium]|nr:hypothetical protein [Leptospirales bacterium]
MVEKTVKSRRRLLLLAGVLAALLAAGFFSLLSFAYPQDRPVTWQHPYLRGTPLVFGHRGDPAHYPENTLASFAGALAAGADILELDVHCTRDGVVVVHHDESLERSAGDPRLIRDLSFSELRQINVAARLSPSALLPESRAVLQGRSFQAPTLAEVLDAFPAARINIEIKQKAPPMEQQLWAVLQQKKALQRVMVGSVSADALQRLRQLSNGAVLTSAAMSEVVRFYLGCRLGRRMRVPFAALQIPAQPTLGIDLASPQMIACAHSNGIQTHYWTVNDAPRAAALLAAGADGLMSDNPRMLVEVRKRHRREHPRP